MNVHWDEAVDKVRVIDMCKDQREKLQFIDQKYTAIKLPMLFS